MDGATTLADNKTLRSKLDKLNNISGRKTNGRCSGLEKEDDDEEEDYDQEVWKTLSNNFIQAQSVLDQNRALIRQVNENHQSKIPDNMVKNVALIREINGNISKVIGLYSDLSVNFSTMVYQSRKMAAGSSVAAGSDSGNDKNKVSSGENKDGEVNNPEQ